MLAPLLHTPHAPHPPNHRRFPELPGIEQVRGSRESIGDHSLTPGDRARPTSPVHSVAAQSLLE
jgi:hypothetical protein